MATMSGWRNSALSSKFIFASSAMTAPLPVSMSGLISASDASVSQNALYRPCSTVRACGDAGGRYADLARRARRPRLSFKPVAGSTNTLCIFSGVLAATSSMSMPPSELAITHTVCVPRSTTRPRYSSFLMSAPSSTRSRRTFWPSGPVWCVFSCMPSIALAFSRTSSIERDSFTPPPLPRPPAWICALTTHTLPPSCFAAATASSTLKHGTPRGVATPYFLRISFA